MCASCAKGGRLLVDTDVLIWLLRGRDSAEAALVTYMELVQGVRNKTELRMLRRTVGLSGWRILPLTETVGQRAALYLESFGLSHGLRLADALIAATAVDAGDKLLTANAKHYRCVSDLALERFSP